MFPGQAIFTGQSVSAGWAIATEHRHLGVSSARVVWALPEG